MEGEEAEEAERARRNKTADLWGIDGIEVEILNFRPDESAFPQGLVQTTFYKASVDAGEVYKVEIKTGLGSCGDDEQGNKGQRHRTVPKKASDHQHEKEVKTVEELLVVGVLHLTHSLELFGPKGNQEAAFQGRSILGQPLFLSQKGTDLIGLFSMAYLQ